MNLIRFFLEREIFRTKVVEKMKNILYAQYTEWAKSRYKFFFSFTGIVNDGRELNYILYTTYCVPPFGPPCIIFFR